MGLLYRKRPGVHHRKRQETHRSSSSSSSSCSSSSRKVVVDVGAFAIVNVLEAIVVLLMLRR